MSDPVRCRAEHAYPGRPLEVWYADRWQQVTSVLEETQTPQGKRWCVLCEGINEFILEYDTGLDQWQVTAVGESDNQTTKESK